MMRKLFAAGVGLAGLLGVCLIAGAGDAPVVVQCTGACEQKVCVPVVETKTVVKPCYTSVCEDVCEPRCHNCHLFGGHCDSCGPNHSCEMYNRKVMIVKLKKNEECVSRCKLETVPACVAPAPCYAPAPVVVPPTYGKPMPTAMPAPTAPMPLPAGGAR